MITTTTNASYKSDEGSDICSNNNVAEEMTTGTTTTIASDDDDIYYNGGGSGTAASTTEEEEDMANCLILLAQGHSRDLTPQHPPLLSLVDDHQTYRTNNNNIVSSNGSSKFVSRKFMETSSTTGKSGYYVYECKTCGKTFSSFQALGEFSSGQALGGHMRRHRGPVSAAVGAAAAPVIRAVPLSVEKAPAAATEMSEEMMITAMKIPPVRNTSTSLLSLLDLNLPAPAEDNAGKITSHDPISKELDRNTVREVHSSLCLPSLAWSKPYGLVAS
uniref:C2H2-type domain-containing protein n=1 Tax=Chenopodium quinoa TaxID=63459 RepID=A0A803M2K5_CHEQI